MKSISGDKQAFVSLWEDLSYWSKAVLIVTGGLIVVGFFFISYSTYLTVEQRTYYRQKINANDRRLENICRKQPVLCED